LDGISSWPTGSIPGRNVVATIGNIKSGSGIGNWTAIVGSLFLTPTPTTVAATRVARSSIAVKRRAVDVCIAPTPVSLLAPTRSMMPSAMLSVRDAKGVIFVKTVTDVHKAVPETNVLIMVIITITTNTHDVATVISAMTIITLSVKTQEHSCQPLVTNGSV